MVTNCIATDTPWFVSLTSEISFKIWHMSSFFHSCINLLDSSIENRSTSFSDFTQNSDSHTLNFINVSPSSLPFPNPMCNNSTFTMRSPPVLNPKFSLNGIGKNGKSKYQTEFK